jgi:hypothetical protein
MADVTAVVDGYIASWNETDAARRRALVEATFADDASYVDPLVAADGRDGIDATIAAVQEQFSGHRFVLAAGPDVHHDRVRFTWHLVPATGDAPVAMGQDFATLDGDGRLRAVTGFLEQVA